MIKYYLWSEEKGIGWRKVTAEEFNNALYVKHKGRFTRKSTYICGITSYNFYDKNAYWFGYIDIYKEVK